MDSDRALWVGAVSKILHISALIFNLFLSLPLSIVIFIFMFYFMFYLDKGCKMGP